MHHVVDVMINVIFFTKLACEGQTGEVLQPVPVNRVYIKPNDEGGEESDVGQQGHKDEDAFIVLVKFPKGDVGQKGKGEQQATDKAKDMGDVVDPGQKATEEEEEDDTE